MPPGSCLLLWVLSATSLAGSAMSSLFGLLGQFADEAHHGTVRRPDQRADHISPRRLHQVLHFRVKILLRRVQPARPSRAGSAPSAGRRVPNDSSIALVCANNPSSSALPRSIEHPLATVHADCSICRRAGTEGTTPPLIYSVTSCPCGGPLVWTHQETAEERFSGRKMRPHETRQ
jgi:hypothetical protein